MGSASKAIPAAQPMPVGAEVVRLEVPGGTVTAISRVWASAADMRRCSLCEAGCTGNLATLNCLVGTRRPVARGEAKTFRLPDPRRGKVPADGGRVGTALRVIGVGGGPDGGE